LIEPENGSQIVPQVIDPINLTADRGPRGVSLGTVANRIFSMKIVCAIASKERHMDAALLQDLRGSRPRNALSDASSQLIPAAEFRKLLISHRRMVRVDRREVLLRGLQDLDTGEVFLTDERRLLEGVRS